MNETHLLAIDAGTGSVRAVIFDSRGRELASASQEWTHAAIPGVPGSMSFDTEGNWDIIVACIRRALSQLPSPNVVAVSATSMREGIVAFDETGAAIWGVANVDSRSSSQVARLKETGTEPFVYEMSGQTFALAAQPRLAWLEEHEPETFDRVAVFAMLSDWVLARLSGQIVSEPSNGSTSGMMSLASREWDERLAARCGLPDGLTPTVRDPGTVIGRVNEDVARETGLSPETLVVVGGGDAQLATLGLGVVGAGETAVIGGSFWQQEVNVASPVVDPDMRIRVNCHVIPGIWQAEGIVFNPGLAARWFRDAFYPDKVAEGHSTGLDAYDLIAAEAAGVPAGSHGILPIFSDAMDYGRWEHAAPSFLDFGLDPTTFGRAAFFRSLMENAAIVSGANIDAIAKFTGTRPTSVVFAGGASKSALWSQILADVLNIPVQVPAVKEATALGTAIAAGVGAGVYPDLATAGLSLVEWESTYEPDDQAAATYAEVSGRWKTAYAAQLELAREGVTTPMWRAPGL